MSEAIEPIAYEIAARNGGWTYVQYHAACGYWWREGREGDKDLQGIECPPHLKKVTALTAQRACEIDDLKPTLDEFEAAARAHGFNKDGDNGGFIYDARQNESLKAALSNPETVTYETWQECCEGEDISPIPEMLEEDTEYGARSAKQGAWSIDHDLWWRRRTRPGEKLPKLPGSFGFYVDDVVFVRSAKFAILFDSGAVTHAMPWDAPSPDAPSPDANDFDPKRAHAEGWLLADNSNHGLRIEKLDDPSSVGVENPLNLFQTDAEALWYVRFRAARGSKYHEHVLNIIHARNPSAIPDEAGIEIGAPMDHEVV